MESKQYSQKPFSSFLYEIRNFANILRYFSSYISNSGLPNEIWKTKIKKEQIS
jgi:hypothetical protein